MNRSHLPAVFALLCASSTVLGVPPAGAGERGGVSSGSQGREQRGGYQGSPRPQAPQAPHVVIKMHQVDVPRPQPIQKAQQIIRDDRRIAYPTHDGRGAAIVKQPAQIPPEHHAVIQGNQPLVKTILGRGASETQRGQYYWHTDNGVKNAHYIDQGGVNWYGFYHGSTFYWTRYYQNRWWWHDDHHARWDYWSDGKWWWQGPDGQAYVYVDNNYYPYEQGGVVTVQNTENVAPPPAMPAAGDGTTTVSPDGTRQVQLVPPRGEAFLYDVSSANPEFIKYIGPNVATVKFSGAAAKPLQILINYSDGDFALLDANGNSIEAPAAKSDVPLGAASDASPPGPPPDGDQPPGPPPAPPQ